MPQVIKGRAGLQPLLGHWQPPRKDAVSGAGQSGDLSNDRYPGSRPQLPKQDTIENLRKLGHCVPVESELLAARYGLVLPSEGYRQTCLESLVSTVPGIVFKGVVRFRESVDEKRYCVPLLPSRLYKRFFEASVRKNQAIDDRRRRATNTLRTGIERLETLGNIDPKQVNMLIMNVREQLNQEKQQTQQKERAKYHRKQKRGVSPTQSPEDLAQGGSLRDAEVTDGGRRSSSAAKYGSLNASRTGVDGQPLSDSDSDNEAELNFLGQVYSKWDVRRET